MVPITAGQSDISEDDMWWRLDNSLMESVEGGIPQIGITISGWVVALVLLCWWRSSVTQRCRDDEGLTNALEWRVKRPELCATLRATPDAAIAACCLTSALPFRDVSFGDAGLTTKGGSLTSLTGLDCYLKHLSCTFACVINTCLFIMTGFHHYNWIRIESGKTK